MEQNKEGTDNKETSNIKMCYLDLMAGLKEKGHDYEYLEENSKEAEKLLEQVKRPKEARYDSELLKHKVHLLWDQAQTIPTGFAEFDGEEYTRKLLEQETGGNSSLNIYEKLSIVAQNAISTPPPFSPLNSCFQKFIPQQKKERKSKVKDVVDKVTKPTLVESSADVDKETLEIAQYILDILHKAYEATKSKPICYFTFVVNPDSFSETVENIFYVSILAREGTVKIFADSNGLPVIAPVPTEIVDKLKSESTYSTSIISLNKADFKKIVESFKIRSAMITHKRK